MASLRQAAADLSYVRVEVVHTQSGLVQSPTGDVVTMAFMTSGQPTSGDFKTANWETDATGNPTRYFARCLVGPGGTTTLGVGVYVVWVKVTDSPEIPVKPAGELEIY